VTDRDRAIFRPGILVRFVIVTLIWGSTWLVITGQLGTVPPPWSVAYRFAIGAAAMFAFLAATGAPLALKREGHAIALAFGLPQFCFNFNLVYMAEGYVTSGLVAVVFALLLVPNSIFAALFLKHRISLRFAAGSIVAVAGVVFLFYQEIHSSRLPPAQLALGAALAVLGVLSASIANIIQAAERLRSHSVPGLVAWGMLYGVIANAVIALVFFGPPTIETSFVYLAGVVYLGLVASATAFTLYFGMLRVIGPGRAAYTSLLIPIIAMTLSTIFEGYRWSVAGAAGGALALAGLFIALNARRAETAPTAS
jgi:drug/metabolite transporter (DMT)-like permease